MSDLHDRDYESFVKMPDSKWARRVVNSQEPIHNKFTLTYSGIDIVEMNLFQSNVNVGKYVFTYDDHKMISCELVVP